MSDSDSDWSWKRGVVPMEYRSFPGEDIEVRTYRITVCSHDRYKKYEQYDVHTPDQVYPPHKMAVLLLLAAHRGPGTETIIPGVGRVDESTELGPTLFLWEW